MSANAGRRGCGGDIVTERLRLRVLRGDDAPMLCRLIKGAPGGRETLPEMDGPCTEDDARVWIARRSRAGVCGLAVTHITFPTLMGITGWGGSSHIPRLFLWMGEAYRGQGFGREVMNALLDHLERRDATHAECLCDPDDRRAQAFLEHAGFASIGDGPGQGPGTIARHFLYDFPPWPDRV